VSPVEPGARCAILQDEDVPIDKSLMHIIHV
jgi:hypothetical protein